MPPKPFKPPSRSASNDTTKKGPKNTSAARKATSPKGAKSSSKSKPAAPSVSISLDYDSDDPFKSTAEPDAMDISPPANASRPSNSRPADQQEEEEEERRREYIPPQLLTKLLHEHFKEKDTRIRKDANEAVGRYMETFVREALARAAYGRVERTGGGAGIGGFLEVEDLEILAPQLLMDF
ncbi:CENP-S associating centromere protein X-domain-containing protein [Calycina marina]|uniref:CENP-S associating centromere protein X-domain-containing protein n=1 Tax=Calycina marina TaxID=1763456 RepID=A0A9P7Z7I5_9HELO|nr:CENP-S associating centromere protein X-domain-containing protein [Calycina marina]